MFIRKAKKKDLITGKSYITYQLVQSTRTQAGPRQQSILSLGGDLSLSDYELKILANRIESVLFPSHPLTFIDSPIAAHIEEMAQKYAAQIIEKRVQEQLQEQLQENTQKASSTEETYCNIAVNSIEHSEPRSVGVEHLLLCAAQELQLHKKLRSLGLTTKEVALSLGSIIARAACPSSERATLEWLSHHSGLGELLQCDFSEYSLNRLYEVSDTLLQHKSDLEVFLQHKQTEVHGYKSTLILYDLTNTYMEGRAKGNPKAKHGFSKEKRTDCPLVTLGLVLNEHGFIARSSILSGNVSEPKTLQQAIEVLGCADSLFKPTIVMDAGIATLDNLEWLRQHQYTYVVCARQDLPSIDSDLILTAVGDPETTGVQAALINRSETGENWLYCESQAKEVVAAEMRIAYQKRFEESLEQLRNALAKPRAHKKYSQVLEKIGRLKERHRRISGCYDIEVVLVKDENTLHEECQHNIQDNIVSSITWEVNEKKLSERWNKRYFLRTNLLHLDAKELWNVYDSIRTVEDAFRFMKSDLGMRPVYHQKEHRVDGHLWITVLAYHLIQFCLYRMKQSGLSLAWKSVRNRLSSRIRITMQARNDQGKILYHRSTTKAESNQREIYRAMNLSPQILQTKSVLIDVIEDSMSTSKSGHSVV